MLMKTVVQAVSANSLRLAKDILNAGGLVAFPTETVYGLGADANNTAAVKNIYKVKGRPQDNPLIVHVHKDYDITSLVYDDQAYVKALRERFLPGPLTLVYKSKNTVSPSVSATGTLALRVPSHIGAQQFLKHVNIPVAAPSANISKHVSPVTAEHVLNDLDGKIALIIDGGKSETGIESTVLDVTGNIPVILRAGAITQTMIEGVCGACDIYVPTTSETLKSPGVKYSHYKPTAETLFFTTEQIADALSVYSICEQAKESVCVICDSNCASYFSGKNVYDLGADASMQAANLYSALRDAEKKYSLIIGIDLSGKDDEFAGIKNRFYKAFSVQVND